MAAPGGSRLLENGGISAARKACLKKWWLIGDSLFLREKPRRFEYATGIFSRAVFRILAALAEKMVAHRGFEPRTPCLKGRCSAN